MSYEIQDLLTQSPTFQGKVRQGIIRYAGVDVINESDSIAFHTERLALARSVLANPHSYATNMAHLIAADDTMDETVSDGAMFARVAYIWNRYAVGEP